jgi:glyoxylase-like metal-dependent hydrolase (beta-lactamase superfamily II)
MVTELGPGVWWLDLGMTNAYLVDDPGSDGDDGRKNSSGTENGEDGDGEEEGTGSLTLIDAGTPRDAGTIARGINEAGYSLSEVERVLITHYDMDHVGALAGLRGLDCPVSVGAADAGLLRGEHPNWANRKGAFQLATGPLVAEPDLAIEPIEDGVEIGGFRAYHTPGHTPGHVAYVNEALSAAFLGDLVIERNGELRPSPWFLSYDTGEVAGSIAALANRLGAFEICGMGHGVPFVRGGSDRLRECAERVRSGE